MTTQLQLHSYILKISTNFQNNCSSLKMYNHISVKTWSLVDLHMHSIILYYSIINLYIFTALYQGDNGGILVCRGKHFGNHWVRRSPQSHNTTRESMPSQYNSKKLIQIFPTRMCNATALRHSRLGPRWLMTIVAGGWGGIPRELQRLLYLSCLW